MRKYRKTHQRHGGGLIYEIKLIFDWKSPNYFLSEQYSRYFKINFGITCKCGDEKRSPVRSTEAKSSILYNMCM